MTCDIPPDLVAYADQRVAGFGEFSDDHPVEKLAAGKPGTKTAQADLRVVDLAERFAEHYQAAGHTSQ